MKRASIVLREVLIMKNKTFIIQDHMPIFKTNTIDGTELLPIKAALKAYPWFTKDYLWRAVPKDTDKHTQEFDDNIYQGFFLRVKEGVNAKIPYNIQLQIHTEAFTQKLHNIVILENNASLELITACKAEKKIKKAAHISVDEYFLGENSNLMHTMLHDWNNEIVVKPHSATIVGKNSRYEQTYIALRTPKFIQNLPNTFLNGEGASAKLLSIIHGISDSIADIGGDVYMNGVDTSAELVHRAISTGGTILQKGLLIANAPSAAHVDCAGILLTDGNSGKIESIPGIQAFHPDARMSHEASIGKISPDQIEYLQSKGMTESEATAFLIRGFIGHGISSIGDGIDEQIANIVTLAGHGEHKF